MMLNLLQIVRHYPPLGGGVGFQVKVLAEALAESGHRITVLSVAPDSTGTKGPVLGYQEEVVNGVRVIRVPEPDMGRLLSRWEAVDLIHLHSPFESAEAQIAKGRTAPFVVTFHAGPTLMGAKNPLGRHSQGRRIRRILDLAKEIIVTSPQHIVVDPLLNDFEGRLAVLPPGLPEWVGRKDTAVAGALAEIKREIPSYALAVGGHYPNGGFEFLLRAFKEVGSGHHLIWIGHGPESGRVRSLADVLDLRESFRCLPETVNLSQLMAYLQGCDFFVEPSLEPRAPMSLPMLAAMANAQPLLCPRQTGPATFVNQENQTGLVVAPRDARALTEAMTRLFASSEQRALLGANGRARFLEFFRAAKMIESYLETYRRALNPRGNQMAAA